jgi:hypothetical protein
MPRKHKVLPRIVEEFEHGGRKIRIVATRDGRQFACLPNPDGTERRILGPDPDLGSLRKAAAAWVYSHRA